MEAPEETNSLDPGGCSSFLRLMYRHGVPQPYQVLLSLLLVVHLPSWYTEILYYFYRTLGITRLAQLTPMLLFTAKHLVFRDKDAACHLRKQKRTREAARIVNVFQLCNDEAEKSMAIRSKVIMS